MAGDDDTMGEEDEIQCQINFTRSQRFAVDLHSHAHKKFISFFCLVASFSSRYFLSLSMIYFFSLRLFSFLFPRTLRHTQLWQRHAGQNLS